MGETPAARALEELKRRQLRQQQATAESMKYHGDRNRSLGQAGQGGKILEKSIIQERAHHLAELQRSSD